MRTSHFDQCFYKENPPPTMKRLTILTSEVKTYINQRQYIRKWKVIEYPIIQKTILLETDKRKKNNRIITDYKHRIIEW